MRRRYRTSTSLAQQTRLVEAWNREHAEGTPVTVRRDDGTELQTRTRSGAWLVCGHASILLDGISGGYLLERCTPRTSAEYSPPSTATFDIKSKQEARLLVFLECCAVDHCGYVDSRRMNAADLVIAEDWAKRGLIRFSRLRSDLRPPATSSNWYTHGVVLSDAAWAQAAIQRKAMGIRRLRAEVVESLDHFKALKAGSPS